MPNLGDVVTKKNTAKHLKKTCNNNFLWVTRQYIPKSDCHHYCSTPIESIRVLNIPRFLIDTYFCHPITLNIDSAHRQDEACHKVCEYNVRKTNLDDTPNQKGFFTVKNSSLNLD